MYMRVNVIQVALTQAFLFGMVFYLFMFLAIPVAFAQTEETQEIQEIPETLDATTLEEESAVQEETDAPRLQDTSLGLGKFSVSPVVANEKAKPRDIIKKELLITNNTAQRVDVYISVENVDPTEGVKEATGFSPPDLSTSLANWVEITRGVIELGPNESRKIPYLIHVNLSAKPGNYYARLQFREGARRSEAEAIKEGSSLMLNVEVSENIKERLQLGNFMSEDSVVLGNTVSFSYLLENVGNKLVEPRGSIRIFNRRGEEVGSIPLNANGEEISPDNKSQLAAAWSATGRFGKYKAFLDLEYGENQLASVQDTVFFWVFPWKEITAAIFGVVVLAIVGTFVIHMSAMAQPARARRRAESRHAEVEEMHQDSYTPVYRNSTLPPSRKHATHLAVREEGAIPPRNAHPQKRENSIQHGATVTLASRDTKSNTKTHGNVIQLSPRN